MPEAQVSKAIEEMLILGKGMPPDLPPENELYRLEIQPITHSKAKPTLKVCKEYEYDERARFDDEGYKPGSIEYPSYAPNQSWIDRAIEMKYEYLMVTKPATPLICRSRGKSGCVASGHHALVICYAMESNMIGMPAKTYRTIVAQDYPGTNPDRERAERELRLFHIPEDHHVAYSSREKRTIKIMAAFVSENWAWVINDFTSLIIMRVFSRNEYWTEEELTPGTKHWATLFGSIATGGPDWILETRLAKQHLQKWRLKIEDHYNKHHFQASLGGQFGMDQDDTRVTRTNPRLSYTTLFKPIIDEISTNNCNSFAGISEYSANDLLHTLGIHPLTPSYVICTDKVLFSEFEQGIYNYLNQFSSKSYLNRASSIPNTDNPFEFNNHLNDKFMSKWILVYQRKKARLPISLYNKVGVAGLLDPMHVIGTPYDPNKFQPLDARKRKWVFVNVVQCYGPNNVKGYTIIKARPPTTWEVEVRNESVETDIKELSYKTSIGPTQFRAHVLNRANYRNVEPGILAIGRPKIERTGKAGRPRKGLSKARIERYIKTQTGRTELMK